MNEIENRKVPDFCWSSSIRIPSKDNPCNIEKENKRFGLCFQNKKARKEKCKNIGMVTCGSQACSFSPKKCRSTILNMILTPLI